MCLSHTEMIKYQNLKKHQLYPVSPILLDLNERDPHQSFILKNYENWCLVYEKIRSGWFDRDCKNACNVDKRMEYPYQNERKAFGNNPVFEYTNASKKNVMLSFRKVKTYLHVTYNPVQCSMEDLSHTRYGLNSPRSENFYNTMPYLLFWCYENWEIDIMR